ncbi:MAG: hypothetical protein ACYDCK_06240 [Thermoplasmatota archaeon]
MQARIGRNLGSGVLVAACLALVLSPALARLAQSAPASDPPFVVTPDPPLVGSPLTVRLVAAPGAANATLHACMADAGVVGVCFRPFSMTADGDTFVATTDPLLSSPQVGVNADARLANGTVAHFPSVGDYVFLSIEPSPVRGVPALALLPSLALALALALALGRRSS